MLASSVTGRCGVGSTALVTGPLSSVCCVSYCRCWSMVKLPSHYALEVGVPVGCQPWIRSGIGAGTHALWQDWAVGLGWDGGRRRMPPRRVPRATERACVGEESVLPRWWP